MKATLTLLAAIATSITTAFGQATITSAWNAVAGDKTSQQAADTTGITPGSAGENQVWNFAQLSPTGNSVEGTYVAASGTPYADSFPTATIASTSNVNGNEAYSYFLASNTEFSTLGIGSSAFTLTYSDPLKQFAFPCTYQTTFTDSFLGTANVNGGVITNAGTHKMTVDGYGTLITPAGGFTDVIRMKSEVVMTSSVTFNGMPVGESVSTSTSYIWISANVRGQQLLSMTHTVTEQDGDVVSDTRSVSYAPDVTTTGINEAKRGTIDASVYPNPASDVVSVDMQLKENADVTVEVIDITGKVMSTQHYAALHAGANTVSVKVNELAKGLYFVRLSDNKQHSGAYKLQVTH